MSIIYKALQKTQKHREQQNSLPIPHQGRLGFWVDIGLMAVIVILLVLVSLNYHPKMPHFFTAEKKPVEKAAEVPQAVSAISANEANFKAKYVLNGVFTTDQTKIAVINNQYFRLGDIIDGMKIVAIGDANVEFQNQTQSITLRVPI